MYELFNLEGKEITIHENIDLIKFLNDFLNSKTSDIPFIKKNNKLNTNIKELTNDEYENLIKQICIDSSRILVLRDNIKEIEFKEILFSNKINNYNYEEQLKTLNIDKNSKLYKFIKMYLDIIFEYYKLYNSKYKKVNEIYRTIINKINKQEIDKEYIFLLYIFNQNIYSSLSYEYFDVIKFINQYFIGTDLTINCASDKILFEINNKNIIIINKYNLSIIEDATQKDSINFTLKSEIDIEKYIFSIKCNINNINNKKISSDMIKIINMFNYIYNFEKEYLNNFEKKYNIIDYKKDFLIINFDEEEKNFDINDIYNKLPMIYIQKPSFIVVCTQNCKMSGGENFQSVLQKELIKYDYKVLIEDSVKNIVSKIYYKNKNVILNKKIFTILPSQNIFYIKDTKIEKSSDEKYGDGLIIINLKILYNSKTFRFSFVNCNLNKNTIKSEFKLKYIPAKKNTIKYNYIPKEKNITKNESLYDNIKYSWEMTSEYKTKIFYNIFDFILPKYLEKDKNYNIFISENFSFPLKICRDDKIENSEEKKYNTMNLLLEYNKNKNLYKKKFYNFIKECKSDTLYNIIEEKIKINEKNKEKIEIYKNFLKNIDIKIVYSNIDILKLYKYIRDCIVDYYKNYKDDIKKLKKNIKRIENENKNIKRKENENKNIKNAIEFNINKIKSIYVLIKILKNNEFINTISNIDKQNKNKFSECILKLYNNNIPSEFKNEQIKQKNLSKIIETNFMIEIINKYFDNDKIINNYIIDLLTKINKNYPSKNIMNKPYIIFIDKLLRHIYDEYVIKLKEISIKNRILFSLKDFNINNEKDKSYNFQTQIVNNCRTLLFNIYNKNIKNLKNNEEKRIISHRINNNNNK